MDVFEAAYRVAHDFKPDGAVGLARRLGKNPGTFLNKLNPHQDSHSLTIGEAVQISTATGDRRILEAFASTMGCGVFVLPDGGLACDMALIELLLARDQKIGAFSMSMERALADGRITRREAAELRLWGLTAIQSLMDLVSRLEAMADE